jgi:hypothetical protein
LTEAYSTLPPYRGRLTIVAGHGIEQASNCEDTPLADPVLLKIDGEPGGGE